MPEFSRSAHRNQGPALQESGAAALREHGGQSASECLAHRGSAKKAGSKVPSTTVGDSTCMGPQQWDRERERQQ